jgi:hypothetical protein
MVLAEGEKEEQKNATLEYFNCLWSTGWGQRGKVPEIKFWTWSDGM